MAVKTVSNITENPKSMGKLLQSEDHMAGMERLEMVVTDIHHPFATVARITGRINPALPKLWAMPNAVLRIEVGEEQNARPLSRFYTVRRFDEEKSLVEIDFILHGRDAPAMQWLEKAREGTSVFLTGPRQHFVPDYRLGGKIVFFADDTAIPALYAILSQWPKGAQAAIYIDCAEIDYAKELPSIEGVSYHIHVRNEGETAGKSGYLPSRAKGLLHGEDWQVWVACEREEARTIRQHFIERFGINKKKMKAIGYWKYGISSSQIEHARLSYYAELHASGKAIEQFEEFDVPV